MSLLKTLGFVICVLAVCAKTDAKPNIQSRVVGGVNATINEFPYQASLQYREMAGAKYQHVCGGIVINEQWVITAGHCGCLGSILNLLDTIKQILNPITSNVPVVNIATGVPCQIIGPSNFQVQTGSTDLYTGGQNTTVTKIVRHPDYNANTIANDIALFQLSSPTSIQNVIAIACNRPPTNMKLILSGWGATDVNGAEYPNNLQKGTYDQVPVINCASDIHLVASTAYVGNGSICAQALLGSVSGSCFGDSGGPLIVYAGGRAVLVGVVSYGISTGARQCASGYPDVYTFPGYHKSFIEEHTGVTCII